MDVGVWKNLVVGYHNGAAIRVKRHRRRRGQSVENNQVGAWVYPGKANDRSRP